MNKKIIFVALLIVALIGTVFLLTRQDTTPAPIPVEPKPTVEVVAPASYTSMETIGVSVEGRPITVHTFGTGDTDLLFVGGIHGGYEWNTILLAYEMIDAFATKEVNVPDTLTVHIIPNLNPDGLYAATKLEGRFYADEISDYAMHETGTGRFNANSVDLNRNFDCRWSESGTWRGNIVSAGNGPFSEPEAVAVRDYVNKIKPAAAIFWHSQAGNVYGAECGGEVASDTLALMSTYASAAGYGEVPIFDAYVVTGAVEDWLVGQGIPTVSVEFKTRTDSEFVENLAGVKAVLEQYDMLAR